MFSRLFGASVPIDRADWHEDKDVARRLLREAKWTALSDMLRGMPVDSAYRLLCVAAEDAPIDMPIEPPAEDGLARLSAGAALIWRAWAYRDYGRGSQVSRQGWAGFIACLEAAAPHLLRSLALGAPGGVVGGFLGAAAKGLGDEDLTAAAERALLEAPEPAVGACQAVLMARTKKWGEDTHEAMWTAARHYANLGRGHPARRALIAVAYFEEWLHADVFLDDRDDARGLKRVLYDSDKASWLYESNRQYWKEIEATPLEDSDWYAENFANNYFAAAFCCRNDGTTMRPHIEAMGPRVLMIPWANMVGHPAADEWSKIRRRAGLSGRVRAAG